MGVHGLWELLAPVGRRVSVETLAGKKLAIDASIWMVQFMKAMRDEKGEMVRNAHILGFFRRICKLLFLRTKPVFVFDGGTPALKRRTVIARRRQRENAQAKIRKTAEKLLLNHLKAMRLKEIAEDVNTQRQSTDVKGKKPMIEESNSEQNTGKGKDNMDMSCNQEELDAMLAASLASEENEGFIGAASISGSGVPRDEVWEDEDEDEDGDEEMVLPEIDGKVDPAVLASLPPSMQLDLLVQMRERLMAENRQKYQKVKKAPGKFSELQIQSYLKTVAFRREINGVQKAAAGRGVGGVQTSRIASEANREFIFSSSFTGDKEAFTSTGQEKTDADKSLQPPVTSSTGEVMPTKRSGAVRELSQGENGKTLHDDLETYTDERGRTRVSRVRALGIRMTRDLQRNLDLMKEMEEKEGTNEKDGQASMAKDVVDVLSNLSDRIQQQEVAAMDNDGLIDEVEKIEDPAVIKGTSIEVSFEDTQELGSFNEDDSLFSCLVAGEPVIDFSVDNSTYPKQSPQSTSDCEWEEGVNEDKTRTKGDDDEVEWEEGIIGDKTSNEDEVEWEEGSIEDKTKTLSDEGEVEWEEGFEDTSLKSRSFQVQMDNTVSKGDEKEETELQEAIRRSLEDAMTKKFTSKCNEDQITDLASDTMILNQPKNILQVNVPEVYFAESNLVPKHLNRDSGGSGALIGEITSASETVPVERVLNMREKQTRDSCGMDGSGHAVENLVGTSNLTASSSVTTSQAESMLPSAATDAQNMFETSVDDRTREAAKIGKLSASDSISDADKLTKDKISGDSLMGEEKLTSQPSFIEVDESAEAFDGHLGEELLFLDKEREELGSEQRRLERNAEAVSSEMFVECQELLQMFGLPYIIAPMEAEAQCAFMELLNLVDGVVTDDSDAFLFGARNVYKNIFDDRKYVETYLLKDIENELGLDREKLIHMALLLGSDYTEGVSGIGIVNAIEVVNAFPEKEGLIEFREWIESPDPNILGNIGGDTKKKGSKEGISSDQNVPDDAERIKRTFMNKHRNVSKNWHIPSSFPSDVVISAYASPQVDKSSESFSWGKPDLSVLRKLCWEKFGWANSKADELLLPVLKEYNKHETQLRLEAFYTFNERFAKIKSKRISKAVKGITGQKSSELMDETIQQSGNRKKRKRKPAEDETIQSGVGVAGNSNQTGHMENPTAKKSKSRQTKETISKKCTNTSKERGKRGGRGRGQASRRMRRGTDFTSGDGERSHDGESSSGRDEELQPDISEAPRRSGRVRKRVNYAVSDELDDCDKNGEDVFDEGAVGVYESDGNIITNVDLEGGISVDGIDQLYNSMDGNNINQMDDPFGQSKLSIDYLQSGGGFCVEEVENDDPDSIPTITDSVNEENPLIDDVPQTSHGKKGLTDEAQNGSDEDSGNPFASSFRAMPNLRRKRRKT